MAASDDRDRSRVRGIGLPERPRVRALRRVSADLERSRGNGQGRGGLQDYFGDRAFTAPRQSASEDFSRIPDALGVPYTYWALGGIDAKKWHKAEAAGRIATDIPANHSPKFAPVIEPTLQTGTAAIVVAALAWLRTCRRGGWHRRQERTTAVTDDVWARRRDDAYHVGNDRLLFGMILGVLAFWLFAQTTLNISPTMAADLGIETSVMNIAVSITALFSGIFIVVFGGLADRVGRVKVVQCGFVLSIVGSLLVGLAPSGALAASSLMLGRICQGLSGACIMPASLALVKAYWDGAGRQRAVSLWSMGSWGGAGFAALFGGLMAENVGWRWIFFASAAVSRGRHADGARHPREQGRGRVERLQVRHRGRSDLHGRHGRAADLRDAGGEARLDERRNPGPAGGERRVRRPVLPRRNPAMPTPSWTSDSSGIGPTPGRRSRTCCSTPSRASSSWP